MGDNLTNSIGGQQGIEKPLVGGLIHRAVQVIAGRVVPAIVAGGTEGDGHVDAVGLDHRRDGVIEIQVLGAGEGGDGGGDRKSVV